MNKEKLIKWLDEKIWKLNSLASAEIEPNTVDSYFTQKNCYQMVKDYIRSELEETCDTCFNGTADLRYEYLYYSLPSGTKGSLITNKNAKFCPECGRKIKAGE